MSIHLTNRVNGEQIDGVATTSSYNNLNQLTGQSPGGAMIFSGTVSKYSTVTVGGNPASLDANNNFRGTATVTTGSGNRGQVHLRKQRQAKISRWERGYL
jgi:hypothetical protein